MSVPNFLDNIRCNDNRFSTFKIMLVSWALFLIQWLHEVSSAGENWGAWSPWPVSCSVTCGPGKRCRTRQCFDGFGKVKKDSDCVGSNTDCLTCVLSSICPRQPGWSAWSDWTECILTEDKTNLKPDSMGCLPGTKTRTRLCNNPPPDVGVNAIFCSGSSREIKRCSYGCPDTPQLDEYSVKARVTQQVQKDHLATRVQRKSPKDHSEIVMVRAAGDRVLLDCNTEAYKMVKETLEAKSLGISQLSLPTKRATISWRLGGRPINHKRRPVKAKEKRLIPPIPDLFDEEERWVSKLDRTHILVQGSQLILHNLKPHDTGLYTCHLKVGDEEWMATFFSVIVLGQQFSAPALMPFYLHSNVGEQSPFEGGNLHWYDAARLVWTHNGEPMFNDLLVRPRARIRLLSQLNNSMQGQWECHLLIPLPNPPTTQASKNTTFTSSFLTNAFFLQVTPRPPSRWELGDRPPRVARLRLIALATMIFSLSLVVAVSLTTWAVRRWVKMTPRLDQMEACVEEVIDDRTRLFLTAKKRARERRQCLQPFLRSEMREILKLRRNPPPEPEEPNLQPSESNKHLTTPSTNDA
uniref:Ig-like domain-containing protein n=1 Tax=Mesocestoides corti TaxID=53468 RepID=A0A5K3FHM8_MESCO